MHIPQIGDKIRFVPSAFVDERPDPERKRPSLPRKVTGKVVFVSVEHRFYDVAFKVNGCWLRESFKIEGGSKK